MIHTFWHLDTFSCFCYIPSAILHVGILTLTIYEVLIHESGCHCPSSHRRTTLSQIYPTMHNKLRCCIVPKLWHENVLKAATSAPALIYIYIYNLARSFDYTVFWSLLSFYLLKMWIILKTLKYGWMMTDIGSVAHWYLWYVSVGFVCQNNPLVMHGCVSQFLWLTKMEQNLLWVKTFNANPFCVNKEFLEC